VHERAWSRCPRLEKLHGLAWIWIPISVFAALMQSVRTAHRRRSTKACRPWARLMCARCSACRRSCFPGGGHPLYRTRDSKYNPAFLLHTAVAALTQVLATALLIHMFRLKNFAVGTMLTKTDIIMTALIGTALFSEQLTQLGWVALVVVVCGTILMLVGRMGTAAFRESGETLSGLLTGRPTRVALMCASCSRCRICSCGRRRAISGAASFPLARRMDGGAGDGLQPFVWDLARGQRTGGIQADVADAGIAQFHRPHQCARLDRLVFGLALQNASYVRAVGRSKRVHDGNLVALFPREGYRA